jgi:hypothetical protein
MEGTMHDPLLQAVIVLLVTLFLYVLKNAY